jgi:hypothetical protein
MKIERAKRHLDELNEAIRSFFESNPYQCSGKPDLAARKVEYTMDSVEPVPDEIPLIAGEIIQNLRTALDHTAYKLYLKGTGGSTVSTNVYFPIADSKQQYDHTKGSKTNGLPSDRAKIDALQPYKGGNNLLWVIHKLNNIDKHRLLLTVGSAVHSLDFTALHKQFYPQSIVAQVNLSPVLFPPDDNSYPLERGTLVFTDCTQVEPIIPPLNFHVVLYERGIIEGKPLTPLMTDMIKVVEQVIADVG